MSKQISWKHCRVKVLGEVVEIKPINSYQGIIDGQTVIVKLNKRGKKVIKKLIKKNLK